MEHKQKITLKRNIRKHEIIKEILKLDDRYDVEFLMRWNKQQLKSHYRGLVIAAGKRQKHESEKQ